MPSLALIDETLWLGDREAFCGESQNTYLEIYPRVICNEIKDVIASNERNGALIFEFIGAAHVWCYKT